MCASILDILVQIYNKGEVKISNLTTQSILPALEIVGTLPYGLEEPRGEVGKGSEDLLFLLEFCWHSRVAVQLGHLCVTLRS